MSAPEVFGLGKTELKRGVSLIEASAGTGKTFNITGIFLRLLLEFDLPVEKILVVTYTVAATEELRGRIRGMVRRALVAVESGESDDALLKKYAAQSEQARRQMRTQLETALHSFDQAPIFTIHGFCQRALRDRAFESGALFDTELVADQSELVGEVLDDFWRRQIYPAGKIAAAFALKNKLGPDNFAKTVAQCLSHPTLTLLSSVSGRGLASLIGELNATFDAARQAWRSDGVAIRKLFGRDASWGNKPYNDDAQMDDLFAQLDACLLRDELLPEHLKSLDAFTPAAIADGTSKRAKVAAPHHRFFDFCAALSAAENRFFQGLACQAVEFVRSELPRRKESLKAQSFDDLLLRLRDALRDAGMGGALRDGLRGQFNAALIDEFQDTDPVQYEIFHGVFASDDHFLFLLGDPKQAIYGFRGADIFTYLRAVEQAARHYTLVENWRSEAGLVRGVSEIFKRNGNAFIFDQIKLEPVVAKGKADATPLHVGANATPPLEIWFAPGEGKGINKGDAQKLLPRTVAAEAARLLNSGARIGDRALEPADLAVLVPENRQAQLVQEALAQVGIPGVLHTTGSVFDAREFAELSRVLAAVAEPSNEALLKGALATDFLGVSLAQIGAMSESNWQERLERFRAYHELWTEKGFVQAFRALLLAEGVRPRLLAFADGARRLTNVLHLGEVLHRATVEQRLGVSGLLKWIAEQETDRREKNDEFQLRLETDERAAKIVTIHKSKGLEYPVVFVPFSWRGSVIDPAKREFTFHDEPEHQPFLELGSDAAIENARLASREELAQNVRLLYVALTRARHRCCFVWGGFKGAETSAAAWLLHPPADPGPDVVESLKNHVGQLDNAVLLADLNELREQSGGTVAVRELPQPSDERFAPTTETGQALACRKFSGAIQRDWRIASFSSLTAGQGGERPDYDDGSRDQPEEGPASGIFAFPRGTKAGTCLHKIFERLDFTQWQRPTTNEIVAGELQAHGIADTQSEAVREMIRKVLGAPLDEGITLETITPAQRLNELEFCFPLNRISAAPLNQLLGAHGFASDERFGFNPVTGLLKGFIDLVFESRGKFYIVDWKSNWLGNRAEDYRADALREEVRRRRYFLQYQLYTVALDKYLRLRLPGYRYDEHFGGAFYVFVRGVGQGRPESGIFHGRPSEKLIRDLGKMLSGDGGRRDA